MRNEKKITILMALKNASELMDISINSVLQQNYKNFTFIFSLGNSHDDTLQKVMKIAENLEVRIVKDQNSGIYEALNAGLALADSDSWVCILGAGDFLLHPDVFNLVNLNLHSRSDWCISPWVYTKSDYEFITKSGFQSYSAPEVLMTHVPLCHQTIFVHLDFLKRLGMFNTDYRVAADRDLIYRMWQVQIPKVLDMVNVVYPQGGFSSNQELTGHSELESLRKKYLGKYKLFSGKKRNFTKTKVEQTRIQIPDNIFEWCPVSIKEGLGH